MSGDVRGIETTRDLAGAKCLCATFHTHRTVCNWSVVSVMSVRDKGSRVTAVSSSSMLKTLLATAICKEKCIGL